MTSTYNEKLKILKTEIHNITKSSKNKFRKPQANIVKFIHNKIKEVEFKIQNKIVFLKHGDDKKGFIHILTKHYNETNDLETQDILNIAYIFKNAIEVDNHNNLVKYKAIKNGKEHILIVDKNNKKSLVVTFYRAYNL